MLATLYNAFMCWLAVLGAACVLWLILPRAFIFGEKPQSNPTQIMSVINGKTVIIRYPQHDPYKMVGELGVRIKR